MHCKICGKPSKDDFFSYVTDGNICSICVVKFMPITPAQINRARVRLGLKDGEYLKQDNEREAARLLGRRF